MRNHSNGNEFDLHENEHASETNFHLNGFALRLVLKQRQKSTRKWPILLDECLFCKKLKYEPNTTTREKLHSVQEFRADETVRACASLALKR